MRPSEQPPFAGWLEEHPDGGFVILHEDGDRSGVLTSATAVDDHFAGLSQPSFGFEVLRIRRVYSDADSLASGLADQKLYPPA